MTKQNKQDQIINSLKEKIGEKVFNKTQIIANSKFGNKEGLKSKFYQSILDGYINPSEIWSDNDIILSLKEKINSSNDIDKEKLITEIIDTYDINTIRKMNPKIKDILKRIKKI